MKKESKYSFQNIFQHETKLAIYIISCMVYETFVFVRCAGFMPVWRNGRRARLKIVRETVGVQVPSPAP